MALPLQRDRNLQLTWITSFKVGWNIFCPKVKYQATKYENSSPLVFYTLSAKKLDLGIELTDFEFN